MSRGLVGEGVVHDFDFHPDEETIRVFAAVDVPRLDADAFVARVRYDEVVLHHYAWASRWFKVNLTTDVSGRIVETAASSGVPSFAFNIDVATPMVRAEREVYAVDLFADVLVRADSVTCVVGDVEEMRQAREDGLISARELAAAERALGEVVGLVEARRLLGLLEETWPLEPASPDVTSAMQRVPVSLVPRLAPGLRSSW